MEQNFCIAPGRRRALCLAHTATPAIGAALMSVSTIIVAVNASMLRLKDGPKPDSKANGCRSFRITIGI
ncbi:MAG: hypothetical protein Q8M08_09985 [Bacteroidales bacterium]|nr:hypothetical protein [Bacteroidales bacterium]